MSTLNDPRVLFSAERTLLAWNRTVVSLMAFGFVIERSGLLLELSDKQEIKVFQRHISFVVGICFILLASYLALQSLFQYRRVLSTLNTAEIPAGYKVGMGMIANAVVALLGVVLSLYLLRGFL